MPGERNRDDLEEWLSPRLSASAGETDREFQAIREIRSIRG